MKVLVATGETQRQRSNDFTWCREGELVKFGSECDGETVDGCCGCRRSMAGVECNKSTTTMKVVWMDLTRDDLTDMLRDNYKRAGWYKLMGPEGAEERIKNEVAELLRMAADFPVGCVVEKRGDTLQIRLNSSRMVR
jgi:hypothetical protein